VFTGIIQHVGVVRAVETAGGGHTLVIDPAGWGTHPPPGASVAVNGCCLTVREHHGPDLALRFDVMRQTLDLTTLGSVASGARVNLEAPVTPTTMLGGHIVQGHVDGVGRVAWVRSVSQDHRLRIEPPRNLRKYIVAQGSIAVDGVSLTVAAVDDAAFEVALIPTTLRQTTLADLGSGSAVNLEADYIARVVVSWLERTAPAHGR
jgi:riboflavin synthase